MKKFALLALLILSICFSNAQSKYQWKSVTSAGYTYKYVTGDPNKTRFYTLANGLKVILSVNKKEPKIRALFGVRAGSNQDPDNSTGLAHYLEHLLFKGTDKIATSNWPKEKVYLKSIDSLYEVYHKATDPQRRKAIYAEIDKTSGIAANYAIANEYDKIVAAMGGQFSNAHTSVEETVYEENIPSGALDKLLALQGERWRHPVFRIFHTELEAVYEEKNRSLDNDGSKVAQAMNAAIFPIHNYGQHTTIGTVEHLKNPSLVQIQKFYDNYYAPNNMGVVLCGDFNPDEAIRKIDRTFAFWKSRPYPVYKPLPEKPITAVITKEIFGPSAEQVTIGFRSTADKTRDALLADLASSILSNGKAGLFDLDLNKAQKVLGSNAGVDQFKDYGVLTLTGRPKQGQTLEQVKDLLLAEIDKFKRGEFDPSLITAIVNNQKFSLLIRNQNNSSRANLLMGDFIKNRGEKYNQTVGYLEEMGAVTKAQLVDFAKLFFKGNNYVIVYKRKGEDKTIEKVDKPVITPIAVNDKPQSAFATSIAAIPAIATAPQWLDFSKDMQVMNNGSQQILYTPNTEDQIFRTYYSFEMGSYNDKILPYAAQYLQFLGTDKKTAEEFSKAFYTLACNFNVIVNAKTTMIGISGLNENYDKAVSLLEDLLTHCVSNEQALADLKSNILKSRANAKTNRTSIMSGLTSYAQYGPENPFNYGLSNKEIESLTAAQLTGKLHELMSYGHKVLYYGPKTPESVKTTLQQIHPSKATYTAYPPQKVFTQLPTDKSQVFYTDYDMVQAEMRWIRISGNYDPDNQALVSVFNSYFGQTIFQVIRESKALAYSASGAFTVPADDKTVKNYITAYVGSQADKFNDATSGMNELLTTLPDSEKSFQAAKVNVQNGIETGRITQENILTEYLRLQRLGLSEDIRKSTYAKLATLTFNDIKKFHQDNLSGKPYNLVVLGSDKRLNIADLQKLGTVKKLSLEELFGY